MGNYSEISVTPSKIKQMIPSGITLGVGDDLFISRMQEKIQYSYLKYPFRIDCYMAAYCVEGCADCTINLTEYHLTSGSVLIFTPGNILYKVSELPFVCVIFSFLGRQCRLRNSFLSVCLSEIIWISQRFDKEMRLTYFVIYSAFSFWGHSFSCEFIPYGSK